MATYNKIPKSAFDELTLGAGVLVKNFTVYPASSIADSDIITATTGGITINITPTFSDLGSDVDNCPANLKELKHIDSYDVSMTTTILRMSPSVVKMQIGAADVSIGKHVTSGTDTSQNGTIVFLKSKDTSIVSGRTYYTSTGTEADNPTGSPKENGYYNAYIHNQDYKISPRFELIDGDFLDFWWVGEISDGGWAAAHFKNALSTAGFSLKTTKNAKGQTSLTMTSHPSIENIDEVPIDFYVCPNYLLLDNVKDVDEYHMDF